MTTHGMARTPTYESHASMLRRCYNPNSKYYKFYGGRNPPITVYEPWWDFQNFLTYLIDSGVGLRPPDTTLDRIRGELGYVPGNIRWATATEQNRNKPGVNQERYAGTTEPVHVLAGRAGMSPVTVSSRLQAGRTLDEALTTPVKAYRREEYTFEGETHSLLQWATLKGINYGTLRSRVLVLGWPLEKALTPYSGIYRRTKPTD